MAAAIRVLIADDDPETRRQLAELLASEDDITVIGSTDTGTQAVELAEKFQPDVVLFDTDMPGLDGAAATERLSGRIAPVGVILLSDHGEPHHWRRAMLAGARDFLVKPVAQEDLLASIRQVHAAQRREFARLQKVAAGQGGNGHAPSGGPETRTGRVVAVFSPKGGVGRTTVAVNIAAAAVTSGHDVCVFDASFQFGDVGIMLDLNPKSGSIADLLADGARRDPDAVEAALARHPSGLHVLLAPPSPEVAELIKPEHVRMVLESLRTNHELVIVDTSNWFNETTLTILDVADVILGVMTLEISNIKNMRLFIQLAQSLGYLDKLELVLNRSDALLGIKAADAEQSLGRKIDHHVVSDGRIVVYALNRGVPFSVSNPEAQVSRDIKRIAEHLLRVEVPVPAEPVDPRRRRRSLLAWR